MELQRTTIRVRKDILRKAKSHTIEAGVSFQDVVNEALRRYLEVPKVGMRKLLKLMDKPLGVPHKVNREFIYKP